MVLFCHQTKYGVFLWQSQPFSLGFQQMNVNIQKLVFENKNGVFECNIWLNVHDVKDVETLCEKLKKIESIKSVARFD